MRRAHRLAIARRIAGSLSFRLAISYAGLFCLSIFIILGLAYVFAVYRPLGDVRAAITVERNELVVLDEAQGRAALLEALQLRAHRLSRHKAFHLLTGTAGEKITNLPSTPATFFGWRKVEADIYEDGEEDDHMALMSAVRLPGGSILAVGRDVENIDQFERALRNGGALILLLTVLLGSAGGALMSRATGARLDAINRAARRVIDGSLSERIPIRGSDDDFDHLAETLNVMLDRIETLIETVARVSDNIAHELRTPLTRLHAALEDIAGDIDPSPAQEALIGAAIAEVSRLQVVFEALLRIARIESHRRHATHGTVDLARIVTDAIELYEPAAEARGITLRLPANGSVLAQGDQDLLFQGVSNLIDNAIKYAPAGGHVVARTWRGGHVAVIEVQDDGPGIPAEHRERVFERFYRVPQTGDRPGSGLGLALVSAVAAAHRSKLTLDDAAPGLRVRWEIPLST